MRRLKKIVSLCLAFLMLLTIFPQQVEAASYELHFTTIMFTKGAEQFHTYSYKLLDDDNKAKITKAVLKDKSLATVSVSSDKKWITFDPKKAGSTTVKVTVKNGSKTKTHSIKLTIYKHENPLTTFKIGKTQYKSKFNSKKIYYAKRPKKTSTVKLNVKAKKGYEITSVTYNYLKNGQSQSMSLENGQSFKLYKESSMMSISYQNTKTGCYSNVVIFYQN